MIRRALVVSALTLICSASLMAQRPNAREGFWIGFGLGPGSFAVKDCNVCDDDERTGGFSGYFRAGGTVSSHVQLGGELTGWGKSEDGIDQNLGFGTFIATVYPSGKGAFFLKFGIGAMSYSADDGINELTGTAPSLSFGLGYDFRLTDNFALTPYLNTHASAEASFRYNGAAFPTGDAIKMNLVQFGLGFHWF